LAYDHRPGAGNYYGLYDYLGIKYIDDGNTSFIGNVDTLEGTPGMWTEGMREKYMLYQPPDHYVDEIGTDGGRMVFRCQRQIGRVVANAGTEVPYRTISAMHVFGAIKNAESTHTKAELMALYLDYLLGDTAPPLAPEVSVSLQDGVLRLAWPPVTQDVNGDPETIAYYVVYRGESAFFRAGSSCVLATTEDTAYDDATAAVGSPTVNHFYVVRAVDASWNPSVVSNRVGEFDFGCP
jgi:hypothetical protein